MKRTTTDFRMKNLYNSKWNNFLLDFSDWKKIFLVVNTWINPNYIDFLNVKAYYICVNWQVQKRLIGFEHIQKKHIDVNFVNIVLKILQNFNVQNRLLAIITNNASINHIMRSSLKNCLNNIKIDWNVVTDTIPCFVYIIQLVVKAFLTELNIQKSNATLKENFNEVSVFNVKMDINFVNIILKFIIYFDNLS